VAGGGLLSRAGVERVVGRAAPLELAGACADLETARLLVDRIRPHIVVTDVRLAPDYSTEGIELALELGETLPQSGVVALSDAPDPALAAAFFSAGTIGRVFLARGGLATDGDLTNAIAVAARGGCLLDPAVLERLHAAENAGLNRGAPSLLTTRDRTALIAIGDAGALVNRLTRW